MASWKVIISIRLRGNEYRSSGLKWLQNAREHSRSELEFYSPVLLRSHILQVRPTKLFLPMITAMLDCSLDYGSALMFEISLPCRNSVEFHVKQLLLLL